MRNRLFISKFAKHLAKGMKHIKADIIIPLIFTLLASCTKVADTVDAPLKELSLEFRNKDISHNASIFKLAVQSNCDWEIENHADWITIEPNHMNYSNSVLLTFRIEENKDTYSRSADINFHYDDGIEKLTISQESFVPYLAISETVIKYGYRAAEKTILINSNCGWLAKSSQTWVSIKPATGLIGNFEMSISVETNLTQEDRDATVRVYNEEYLLEKYIEIKQFQQAEPEIKHYIDEYGTDRGEGKKVAGLVWAPVNCGFSANNYPYGKIYQWGRKFGQGYQDENFKDVSSANVADCWSGINGEEDSESFYKYTEDCKYNYDWIKNGDNSYWNCGTEEYPVKNKTYDPCPEGWRIPTSFEFRSLVQNSIKTWREQDGQYGYLFCDSPATTETSGLFLPAGGRLNITDGKSYDRNEEGYYWTMSTSSGSSAYLYFHSENCSINSQGCRAGGCLLRCIRE